MRHFYKLSLHKRTTSWYYDLSTIYISLIKQVKINNSSVFQSHSHTWPLTHQNNMHRANKSEGQKEEEKAIKHIPSSERKQPVRPPISTRNSCIRVFAGVCRGGSSTTTIPQPSQSHFMCRQCEDDLLDLPPAGLPITYIIRTKETKTNDELWGVAR